MENYPFHNPSLQLKSTNERILELVKHLESQVSEPHELGLLTANGHRLIDILYYVYDGGDLDEIKESIDRLLK